MPMTNEDACGLPVTAGVAAIAAYDRGVRAMLQADVGAEQALDEALRLQPDFALAQVARARLLWLRGELPAARTAAVQARESAAGGHRRERQHVQMIALTVEGRPVQALAAARAHLAEFPRDAMVVAPCTNVFGLFGFSGRPAWEHDLALFLDTLAPAWGNDGWFASLQAFALSEIGEHARAAVLIDRSLAQAPRNAHGAHGRAHLLYELGEPSQVIPFLSEWLRDYPADGQFRVHLNWHLALSLLQVGDSAAAWQVYRDTVAPGACDGPPLNVVTDAAAFLWRAELAGQSVDLAQWRSVADFGAAQFPQPGLAFADYHIAMAMAATGEHQRLSALAAALQSLLAKGRLPAGPVVPAMVGAFGALRSGDPAQAVALLAPLLGELERVGGSRAQRDLPAQVCLAAARLAGARVLADTLAREPRLQRLAATAGARMGGDEH